MSHTHFSNGKWSNLGQVKKAQKFFFIVKKIFKLKNLLNCLIFQGLINESSIVLAKYLLFLQLHTTGFYTQSFSHI